MNPHLEKSVRPGLVDELVEPAPLLGISNDIPAFRHLAGSVDVEVVPSPSPSPNQQISGARFTDPSAEFLLAAGVLRLLRDCRGRPCSSSVGAKKIPRHLRQDVGHRAVAVCLPSHTIVPAP